MGNLIDLTWSLRGLGFSCFLQGDFDKAQYYLENSLEISQKIENDWMLAWSLFELGNLALAKNNIKQAEQLLHDVTLQVNKNIGFCGVFSYNIPHETQ